MAGMKWQFFAMLVLAAVSVPVSAQAPPAPVRLVATTQNVSGAGESIKINISSWSGDAEKQAMVAAWTLANAQPAAGAAGQGGRGGRGGAARGGGARGGGRGGNAGARGAAPAAAAPAGDAPADPDAVDPDNPAFRFGRGGARGAAEAAATSPEAALAAALKKAPTIGVLWTSETVGFSIKYAYREQEPDGTERIILATDRRVGAWSTRWKPSTTSSTASGPAMEYPFSIIELRLSPNGAGEGRGVIFGKVAVDGQSRMIALDGYAALPVVLKGVKRQPAS